MFGFLEASFTAWKVEVVRHLQGKQESRLFSLSIHVRDFLGYMFPEEVPPWENRKGGSPREALPTEQAQGLVWGSQSRSEALSCV